MTTPPAGPDQPSHGHEYPPLENSGPSTDAYPPLDYPTGGGQLQQGAGGQFGYPPPVYPAGGYPQAGYPPPPPAGAPYQAYQAGYQAGYPNPYDPYGAGRPPGTNGKAIGALVTSLVGLSCCGLPGVVGIILGIMAMREVKQTGQDGHGLALAGVIVGALGIALGIFGVVFGVFMGIMDDTSSYSSY